MRKSKGLGIALGGGGARGLAHMGVLLELERAGLAPEMVAGTSMGAIIGGLYAAGQDLKRVFTVLTSLDLKHIFGLSESYRRMLEHSVGQTLIEHLRGPSWQREISPRMARFLELLRLFGKGLHFEDLPVEFVAVAADVHTGEEVDIDEGPLYLGMAASAALPGVLQPLRLSGRWMIDGGVVNNLPADVVLDMGAGVVVAVDVSARLEPEPRTVVDILLRSYAITAKELARVKLDRVRERLGERLLYVRPEVEEIGVLEFERLAEAVEAGRAAAQAAIPRIRTALG
ncbi:hypothetical protein DRJ54_06815 [Candidatus Acetothermia bacterium]|nr:MAG: hypothetical protein DRJ54_06815 [Candidatus Acetothermia bacterium]